MHRNWHYYIDCQRRCLNVNTLSIRFHFLLVIKIACILKMENFCLIMFTANIIMCISIVSELSSNRK